MLFGNRNSLLQKEGTVALWLKTGYLQDFTTRLNGQSSIRSKTTVRP